jgi:hypothetical protein
MRNLDRLRSGDEVIKFMAENLVYGPGSFEGEPWRPLDWQADLVHRLYDPARTTAPASSTGRSSSRPKGPGRQSSPVLWPWWSSASDPRPR